MLTTEEFIRQELQAMPVGERVRFLGRWVLEDPEWQANPLWIYAIRAGDYGGDIKIGSSRDPYKRLTQLQTSNAEQLVGLGSWPTVASIGMEKLLHEQYADSRIRGEWFMHCLPLLRLIRDYNLGTHWKGEP